MDKGHEKKKILLGITGASGMLFVNSFLTSIAGLDVLVHGICSTAGRNVLKIEQGLCPEDLPGVVRWFQPEDFSAPPASGSNHYDSMVVLPCTMGSLAAVANGLCINLIHRAADVMLKERRRVVFAIRETPFNRTHLRNMLAVHDAGGIICPTLPSYYLRPETLAEAAQTYSWRLADQLGIDIPERKRWNDLNLS
jgi:flavin prenyltransferase